MDGRTHPGARIALSLLVLAATLGLNAVREASNAWAVPEGPNVLIFLTDDQRAAGTMASLPYVRRWFERGGRKFPDALDTTPLCCPSRTSLVTGLYAHNHGIVDNTRVGREVFDQDITIQRYLDEAGYRTGFVGKFFNFWQVETDPKYFDRWAIYDPNNVQNGYYHTRWNIDGRMRDVDRYSTDFIAALGARFIQGAEADDDRPWFLQLSTFAPHMGPGPEPRYANAPIGPLRITPAMRERDRSDKPPFVQRERATLADARRAHEAQLRMLMSVDDLVAKISKTLRRAGETRDTLAFFLSDNGYLWSEHRIQAKGYPYAEGVHVPLLMRWPGHVDAGTVDRRIVAILDIAPTILGATGIEVDAAAPMDGRSLLDESWERSRLLLEYWHWRGSLAPPWASTWTHEYQYIEYYEPNGDIRFREYYDLDQDPWELVNLLGDGRAGNDPDVGPLHRQLEQDRTCAPTTCP